MTDAIEIRKGKASMAYVGEVPWHGLGKSVLGDLTPEQFQHEAGLDWTVEKTPCLATIDGVTVGTGHSLLYRSDDRKQLDVVTEDWWPVQNSDAFDFFYEYVMAGEMSMETAGSLQGGRIVWALAKINEAFSLFRGKDVIEAYMLFTNPHKYGWSTSVSHTAIRVVCQNTLVMSLAKSGSSDRIIRKNHRKEFVSTEVKELLGISKTKLKQYKEAATFLASKKSSAEELTEYLQGIFPVITKKEDSKKEFSKSVKKCLESYETQPGAALGEGTWWHNYNTVTHHVDYEIGRENDSRLTSAWYGAGRKLKIKALELALEMAS